MLDTLDFTIRIGSTPTFLYFDLYLYSAYAAHYVYFFNILFVFWLTIFNLFTTLIGFAGSIYIYIYIYIYKDHVLRACTVVHTDPYGTFTATNSIIKNIHNNIWHLHSLSIDVNGHGVVQFSLVCLYFEKLTKASLSKGYNK